MILDLTKIVAIDKKVVAITAKYLAELINIEPAVLRENIATNHFLFAATDIYFLDENRYVVEDINNPEHTVFLTYEGVRVTSSLFLLKNTHDICRNVLEDFETIKRMLSTLDSTNETMKKVLQKLEA